MEIRGLCKHVSFLCMDKKGGLDFFILQCKPSLKLATSFRVRGEGQCCAYNKGAKERRVALQQKEELHPQVAKPVASKGSSSPAEGLSGGNANLAVALSRLVFSLILLLHQAVSSCVERRVTLSLFIGTEIPPLLSCSS